MNYSPLVTEKHKDALAQARLTYGLQKQLSICAEECNELAIVCNKHCRYDTPEGAQKALHDEALTEIADVLIVLDHAITIFGVSEQELALKIDDKINRLKRWLSKSTSLEQSTRDRALDTASAEPKSKIPCGTCEHYLKRDYRALSPGGACFTCKNGSNYKPKED